jgi:hypothetical protein
MTISPETWRQLGYLERHEGELARYNLALWLDSAYSMVQSLVDVR